MSRSPSPSSGSGLSIAAASPSTQTQGTPAHHRAPLHPPSAQGSGGEASFRSLGDVMKSPGVPVASAAAPLHSSPHPGVNPAQVAAGAALRQSLHIPPTHPLSAPAAAASSSSSTGGWFSGWIGQAVAAASPFPTNSPPPMASQPGARTPMAKTGDDWLDQYATSVDAMQAEMEAVRRMLLDYAERIITMSVSGTALSEYARHLASEAPLDPAALLAFADAHDQSGSQAATLFRDEFELEVLEPLAMWHEESEQFLRELQRTALAYRKSEEVRLRVDRLLMEAAEAAQAPEDNDADDVEAELQLKLAKTDLGEACTNYSARCVGLKRHFGEVSYGRAQALDVAFTRVMAQFSFLLRPTLRIVEAQLHSDSAAALLSPSAQTGIASGRHDGSSGSGTFFGSPKRGSRAHFSSATLPAPRGARKSTLEEDIVRMSRRVNRRVYQPQTHHYHGGVNGASGVATYGHEGHEEPRVGRLMAGGTGAGERRGSVARAEDSAILSACRQLQEEIHSRKSTEAANDELRRQLDQLKEEAGGNQASLSAQSEIEELKRKLNEREAALAAAQANAGGAPSDSASTAVVPVAPPAVPIPDAPMAPPMDIPPPPPMAPPGAPGGGYHAGGGGLLKHRVLTAREKELAEAKKFGLPLLPEVDQINSDATPTKGRIQLKKLHWISLTPEEVLAGTGATGGGAGAESSGDNVWKRVFLKALKEEGEGSYSSHPDQQDPPPHHGRKLSIVERTEDELALLVAPLIPNSQAAAAAGHKHQRDDSSDEKHDDGPHSSSPPTASSSSDSDPFAWRWPLDLPTFTSCFAQKAAVQAMKKKVVKANKYALGRQGSKVQASLEQAEEDDDSESAEEDGEEDTGNDDDEKHNGEDATTPSSSSSSTSSRQRKKKPSAKAKVLPRVELIDAKRSYNVSISLTHFKLAPEVVRDAILLVDERGTLKDAGGDLSDLLLDILPTSEESKLIADWIAAGGDPARLGDVEKFFLAMSRPGLASRLKALNALETFSQTAGAIEDNLEAVHSGLRGLDGAASAIAVVLSIVLRVGNLMNASNWQPIAGGPAAAGGGSLKGKSASDHLPSTTTAGQSTSVVEKKFVRTQKQAYGFQVLSTLHKLRAVKALESATALSLPPSDGSTLVGPPSPPPTTLLHFLVSYVHTHVPLAGSALRGLAAPLRECSRVEQAFVQAEIKHLGQSLKAMKVLMEEDQRRRQAATDAPDAEEDQAKNGAVGPAASPLASPTSAAGSIASSTAGASTAYVPLPKKVYDFYDYAAARLAAIERQLALLQQLYTSLLSYYLIGDVAATPWESFLSGWSLFTSEWVAVEEEQAEWVAQREKKIRQAQAQESMKLRREEATKLKLAQAQSQQSHQPAPASASAPTPAMHGLGHDLASFITRATDSLAPSKKEHRSSNAADGGDHQLQREDRTAAAAAGTSMADSATSTTAAFAPAAAASTASAASSSSVAVAGTVAVVPADSSAFDSPPPLELKNVTSVSRAVAKKGSGPPSPVVGAPSLAQALFGGLFKKASSQG